MKKTFENSTQDFSGVRHEREVMHKKSSVEIFPGLSDPLRGGISWNKETFSVDLLADIRAGKIVGALYFTE